MNCYQRQSLFERKVRKSVVLRICHCSVVVCHMNDLDTVCCYVSAADVLLLFQSFRLFNAENMTFTGSQLPYKMILLFTCSTLISAWVFFLFWIRSEFKKLPIYWIVSKSDFDVNIVSAVIVLWHIFYHDNIIKCNVFFSLFTDMSHFWLWS